MNKHLVTCEKEYVNLFKDFELEDAEEFLGVEFAYQDGTYQSDMSDSVDINENQDIDFNTYRKRDDSEFPEEYPCLVLLANERDWDRQGNIAFKMLDFVYLKDFQ